MNPHRSHQNLKSNQFYRRISGRRLSNGSDLPKECLKFLRLRSHLHVLFETDSSLQHYLEEVLIGDDFDIAFKGICQRGEWFGFDNLLIIH